MRRNKQTTVRSSEELTSLTERILSQMGREGAAIRRRLTRYYRQRALKKQTSPQAALKDSG